MNNFSLQIREVVAGAGSIVSLSGTLREETALSARLPGLTGTVIFDLDRLERITSFGVREWLTAFRGIRADYYAFVRCRPALVAQFNMVAGFAVRGELVSLYAPYRCPSCDLYFEKFVDLRHDYAPLTEGDPPDTECGKCGALAQFDDLPEQYFYYVASRRRPYVPRLAQRLMDGVDSPSALRVRKTIEGATTVVSLSGGLLAQPGLARNFEGLEGTVIIDLSGITQATAEGFGRLDDLLAISDPNEIWYRSVRPDWLDQMPAGMRARRQVVSLSVTAPCQSCETSVDFEIDLAQLEKMSTGGGVTEAVCPRCETAEIVTAPPTVVAAARSAMGTPPPEVRVILGISEPTGVLPPTAATQRVPIHYDPPPPPLPDVSVYGVVGVSSGLRSVVDAIARVAPSDATVLLRGETGTGKEMLARTLHRMSARAAAPFVAVNCAALPEGLVESELFGHEAGAFTGATGRSAGRFERADGGTLFIDEVGDLPMAVQVKLLRVLQEGAFERVGGRELIDVDVRLVGATHRDLEQMIATGEFREDLYYRLNVVPVAIPPLRDRPEDIWPLTEYYLAETLRRQKKQVRPTPALRTMLEAHDWPGNVRELVNVIERIVALTPDGEAAIVPNLPPRRNAAQQARGSAPPPVAIGASLREAMSNFERDLIVRALERAGGNRTVAARELGISRQALNHKLQKYDL